MTVSDAISRYIDPETASVSPERARLRDYGVEVWILVAQLPAYQGDIGRLANDYGVPTEAVDAALGYYRRNKAVIDAQILLNTA